MNDLEQQGSTPATPVVASVPARIAARVKTTILQSGAADRFRDERDAQVERLRSLWRGFRESVPEKAHSDLTTLILLEFPKVAQIDSLNKLVKNALAAIAAAVVVVIPIICTVLGMVWTYEEWSVAWLISSLGASAVIAISSMGAVLLFMWYMPLRAMILLLFVSIPLYAAVIEGVDEQEEYSQALAAVAAAAALGLSVDLLVFMGLALLVQWIADFIIHRSHPVEVTVMYLLFATPDLHFHGPRMRRAARTGAMLSLEMAAETVEKHVRGSLDPGDLATSAWLDDLFDRVAAGIRLMKRGFAVPGSMSREQLRRELGTTLGHIALGEWNKMRQAAPLRRSSLPVRERIGRAARFILSVGMPVAGYIAFQQSEYELEGTTNTWVVLGVGLWVVVSVLDALDPRFREKVSAFKDVTGLLSGGSASGGSK